MTGIRAVFLFSASVVVLVSGYQGDGDQDAYLETLLKRLLDHEALSEEKPSLVDELTARQTSYQDNGIVIDSEIRPSFDNMWLKRSSYSWIIFKIEDKKRIVIDSKGLQNYWEFVAALKKSGEPRFAVYDVPEDWEVGRHIVFIFWLPDDAASILKMIYVSSHPKMKATLNGLLKEIQINDKDASLKHEIIKKLG